MEEDTMDVVYRLNEHYDKFVSEYSRLYESGNVSLADSLYRTWSFYLMRTLFDSKDFKLKCYINDLRQNTDQFVAQIAKNGCSTTENELPKRVHQTS